MVVKPRQIEIEVSGLHVGQHRVLKSLETARFGVLAAGRRWGKTRLGVAKCIVEAVKVPGGYFWVTPEYGLAEEGWDILKEFSFRFPRGFYKIEEQHLRVRFGDHGWVQIKSTHRGADVVRSRGLRGAVLDEAGLLRPDVWPTLRPALADLQGWAFFIGTPKGRNWFFRLFQRAEDRKGWVRFQRSSHDNPRLTDEEIAEIREEVMAFGLSPSQEIDAVFEGRAGAIFAEETFRHWWPGESKEDRGLYLLNLPDEEEPKKVAPEDCWRFQTVDTASSEKDYASFFVLSTWAVTPDRDLILLDRFRKHASTTKHLAILRREFQKHRPSYVGVENAHVGIALVQAAIRAGLPIKPIRAERDKVSRARVAQARYDVGKVYHPARAEWLGEWEEELLDFPDGTNDDQVDTASMAAIEIAQGSFGKMKRGRSIWK
jgi:predicted phage terminase large subunit-like protein